MNTNRPKNDMQQDPHPWIPVSQSLPPDGVEVEAKYHAGNISVRWDGLNFVLSSSGLARLNWPTHWRHILPAKESSPQASPSPAEAVTPGKAAFDKWCNFSGLVVDYWDAVAQAAIAAHIAQARWPTAMEILRAINAGSIGGMRALFASDTERQVQEAVAYWKGVAVTNENGAAALEKVVERKDREITDLREQLASANQNDMTCLNCLDKDKELEILRSSLAAEKESHRKTHVLLGDQIHDLRKALAAAQQSEKNAWANQGRFCREINIIGKEIIGPRINAFKGDCVAPDAVTRENRLLIERIEKERDELKSWKEEAEGELLKRGKAGGELADMHLDLVKERDELAAWKNSQLTVTAWWSEIDAYIQAEASNQGLIGERVAYVALKWLKERDELRARLEEKDIWLRAIERESTCAMSRDQARKALLENEPFTKTEAKPALPADWPTRESLEKWWSEMHQGGNIFDSFLDMLEPMKVRYAAIVAERSRLSGAAAHWKAQHDRTDAAAVKTIEELSSHLADARELIGRLSKEAQFALHCLTGPQPDLIGARVEFRKMLTELEAFTANGPSA